MAMFVPVQFLLPFLFGGFVGQCVLRPHLSVGVGIGAPHHGPLVLKDLHPRVIPPQVNHLLGLDVHYLTNVGRRHLRQG